MTITDDMRRALEQVAERGAAGLVIAYQDERAYVFNALRAKGFIRAIETRVSRSNSSEYGMTIARYVVTEAGRAALDGQE